MPNILEQNYNNYNYLSRKLLAREQYTFLLTRAFTRKKESLGREYKECVQRDAISAIYVILSPLLIRYKNRSISPVK